MTYSVKEMFYTLQGEGAHAGRPAVFCRFTGCNLWSGREQHRASAVCQFCDTDFIGTDGIGGGKFKNPATLARAVKALWPVNATARARPYVVCTGGEPLLQLDERLLQAFHAEGLEVAIETNGTVALPLGVDWVCVSPKQGSQLLLREGDELKLVYPQAGFDPAQFANLKFEHFYLQPMDNDEREQNTVAAINYCLQHPQWHLSLQTHKITGIA
ncbi:MAG: 7-carboxy-7-deazaguanine synthase [Gammaproteobacteria bacterium]|nr:7-carboxy-7-deazaguanine synthase [Gammaproteobacteria bacterium]